MLKIRLQRIGRINLPSYRVVVTEHTRAPQAGKFVERLGSYNPRTKERILNTDRIKYWLSVGAQPSDTMHNMLITAGIIEGKKINVLPKKAVAKVATSPDAEVVADTLVETPSVAVASPEETEKTETVTETQ
jgi:small subunit ribosomal protein S16